MYSITDWVTMWLTANLHSSNEDSYDYEQQEQPAMRCVDERVDGSSNTKWIQQVWQFAHRLSASHKTIILFSHTSWNRQAFNRTWITSKSNAVNLPSCNCHYRGTGSCTVSQSYKMHITSDTDHTSKLCCWRTIKRAYNIVKHIPNGGKID